MIKVLGGFKTQFGVVAHLGERIHGMDEVEGSSPFSSIFLILICTKVMIKGLFNDFLDCPIFVSQYCWCVIKPFKELINHLASIVMLGKDEPSPSYPVLKVIPVVSSMHAYTMLYQRMGVACSR